MACRKRRRLSQGFVTFIFPPSWSVRLDFSFEPAFEVLMESGTKPAAEETPTITKTIALKPGAVKPGTDPAHDVLRTERNPLDAVFNPKCVAVVGATEAAG